MNLLTNSIQSLIVMDIYANLMSQIGNNLLIKPRNYVIGFAEKVLQKITQTDIYTPDLPIVSCIPGDINPDESHFPWHMNNVSSALYKFGFKVACFDDFEIRVIPYLYTIHCDIQYTGQSYPDVLNARITIEELFGTRKVLENEMTSIVTLDPSIIENLLTPEQLETLEQFIPKQNVNLANKEFYVIPYQFRYFVKLTGQSDTSSLFGETKLVPDYMSSYNFEIVVNLPTKIILKFKSTIKQININYPFQINKTEEETQDTNEKPNLIEFYDYEIDADTGSLIVHHIIKAEEESNP